jgi:hypothetical protein
VTTYTARAVEKLSDQDSLAARKPCSTKARGVTSGPIVCASARGVPSPDFNQGGNAAYW